MLTVADAVSPASAKPRKQQTKGNSFCCIPKSLSVAGRPGNRRKTEVRERDRRLRFAPDPLRRAGAWAVRKTLSEALKYGIRAEARGLQLGEGHPARAFFQAA